MLQSRCAIIAESRQVTRAQLNLTEAGQSAKALGKPLRDPSQVRAWEHGISVFDSPDYAKERARSFRFLLGRWIVPIRIPHDAHIEIEQTGNDQHHLTIYAAPELLLSFVAGNAVAAEEG